MNGRILAHWCRRAALALLLAPAAGVAGGAPPAELSGYLQIWGVVVEQAQNGLRQPASGDEAADECSGFSLKRARLRADLGGDRLRGRVELRLEGSPVGLLDAFVQLPLHGEALALTAGQMKVPATYEDLTPSTRLDFLTRSQFSSLVVDYSLARSPSLSAPRFTGLRTYLRDLGLALDGRWRSLRGRFMVGNGLGANHFIGAEESRQEIYANRVGAYMYAVRLDWALPGGERLRAGGHFLYNHHPNVLLDDKRTVTDIERRSWSADLRLRILAGLSLTGLYGQGVVGDDLDDDGRDDYHYRGWELKAIVWPVRDRLQAGLRYDVYTSERYENGSEDTRRDVTAGASWRPRPDLRLQVNYKWKILDSESDPDLDDDSLIAELQATF